MAAKLHNLKVTKVDFVDEGANPDAHIKLFKRKEEQKGEMAHPAEDDAIYKGLHPTVRAEIEELKKFREAAELKELEAIAKRYEIIGKKTDEFVAVLKELKEAGGSAYDDMIATMDSIVETIEKSGLFAEIGKSGGRSSGSGSWERAEVKAEALMKTKTGLTKQQALDEVLMSDPELAKECVKED